MASDLLESTIATSDDTSGRPVLIVFQAGTMTVIPLLGDGVYTIGRGSGADISIDDKGVSRRQAEIRLAAGVASVADLDSVNGTRVNGQLVVEETVLASGDVITAGGTPVVFSRGPAPSAAAEVLPAAAFTRRFQAEVERSLRYLRPLTLLLLGRGERRADDELLVEAVAGAVRPMDLVGKLDAGTLAVLMPEMSHGEGRFAAAQVFAMARRADDRVRGGAAAFPDDGCGVDALLEGAQAALARAAAGELGAAEGTEEVRRVGSRAMIVADSAMTHLVALVERLGPTEISVLITGETGTGKELVARLVHELSPRAAGPFVAVNCAALPENLAESELFGHARGAYTGALEARAGHLEAARGGTLLLDEVGEMPLAVQAKLLRVLEDKRVARLGESGERPIDVRIVAATNTDLRAAVQTGRFRRDLYFRLAGASVVVPPLRQRPREIPALTRHLVAELGGARAEPIEIAPATMRLLATHSWPGNVRELRNALERAVALASGRTLEPWMLPVELHGDGQAAPGEAAFTPLAEELADLERRRIVEALDAARGVQSQAAAMLKVPLRTFYMKVKQLGLRGNDDRELPDP